MVNVPSATLAAALAVILCLTGCTAGGGTHATTSDTDLDEPRSDPRFARALAIAVRADTLRVPSIHFDFTLYIDEHLVGSYEGYEYFFECFRVWCTGILESTISVEGLSDESVDFTEVTLGTRGGFDTAVQRGSVKSERFELGESIGTQYRGISKSRLFELGYDIETAIFDFPSIEIEDYPTVVDYGLWGEHGFASVYILAGPFSGTLTHPCAEPAGAGCTAPAREKFTGPLRMAGSRAFGDTAGTNPLGIGGAAWRGIAEAASPHTFERYQGTAVFSIPDLADPRLNAAIAIDGHPIGSPAWASIPLENGSYEIGAQGHDFLSGDFYGPAHAETYGVFDTGAYVGAFGAKR